MAKKEQWITMITMITITKIEISDILQLHAELDYIETIQQEQEEKMR